MPISGYELLIHLKEKTPASKIAFVTILPKQEVDMSDVDGFIQKPFSFIKGGKNDKDNNGC